MQFITTFALSLAALATATPANEYRSVLGARQEQCCCVQSAPDATCLEWKCLPASASAKRKVTALETRQGGNCCCVSSAPDGVCNGGWVCQ